MVAGRSISSNAAVLLMGGAPLALGESAEVFFPGRVRSPVDQSVQHDLACSPVGGEDLLERGIGLPNER